MAKKKQTRKKATPKKAAPKKVAPKKATPKKLLTKLYDSTSVYTTHWIRDYEVSKKFYSEVLEFPVNLEIPEAGWYEYKLPVKGAMLGLSQYHEGDFKTADSLNISIKDVDQVKKALESKGVKATEIVDLPDMISMTTIQDPDENNIYFIGPPRIKSKED